MKIYKIIKDKRYELFLFFESIMDNFLIIINYLFFLISKKETKNRVLITRLDSIGDFVLFTASLPNYRKLYKDYEIVLLVKDIVYDLARNCPHVDKVWKISQKKFRKNIVYKYKWLAKIRKYNFSKAIQPIYSNNFDYFNVLIMATFAKERIAYKTGKRSKIYFNRFILHNFEIDTFEIIRNNKMIEYLGYKGSLNTKAFIWFDEEIEYVKWNFLLKKQYAVLFPGAQIDYRKFDKEKYLKILEELKELDWVICGGKDEKYLGEFFKKNCKNNVIDLIGKTDLLELAYIIKNAQFLLSNETVAVHIAAATNTKTFCVMGGGHYGRFYPYPNNENTIAITHKMDCFNCDWQCIYSEKRCITEIKDDDVFIEVKKIIDSIKLDKYEQTI